MKGFFSKTSPVTYLLRTIDRSRPAGISATCCLFPAAVVWFELIGRVCFWLVVFDCSASHLYVACTVRAIRGLQVFYVFFGVRLVPTGRTRAAHQIP